MTFVKEISEKDPNATLFYNEILNTLNIDTVPNILKTTTIDLEIAQWFWQGIKIILLRESDISRTLKESIAVVVSEQNSCRYCSNTHGMILRSLGFTEEKLSDLKNNFKSFSEKEKVALNFALKINNSANSTITSDHQLLRDHGYTDKQIVEITSVVALFNWANIIADALGTQMES